MLPVRILALLTALLAATGAGAVPSGDTRAPVPMPRSAGMAAAETDGRRCTGDGAVCIARSTYIADVCRVIGASARANGLDAGFFARLVWRESLFDASAVSPAGAQGIAQFIPETAKRRGLADAFNPAEALVVSARYLADLRDAYGNIGLAAAAYNGGEARVERFIAEEGGLAAETRAYVMAITGHSAEAWRDAPPATVDLALAPKLEFEAACVAQASNRKVPSFRTEPVLQPWGVVVASSRERDSASRQVARLQNRHAGVLAGEPVSYTRTRRAGMAYPLTYAQIGRPTRTEAEALCQRLRAAGGDCMVLRN